MVVGVGVDLAGVTRIAGVLERRGEAVSRRLLSPNEFQLFVTMSSTRQAEFLAGRFAAKEAVAKAIGCGLARLQPASVDIQVGAAGLSVRFLGRPPAHLEPHDTVHVTISHAEGMAIAFALVERPRLSEPPSNNAWTG